MSDVLPQQLKSQGLSVFVLAGPILLYECMLALCVLFTFLGKLCSLKEKNRHDWACCEGGPRTRKSVRLH